MAASYSRIIPVALGHIRFSSHLSRPLHYSIRFPRLSNPIPNRFISTVAISSFTWHDVFRAMADVDDDPSNLQGYFDRVRACNRRSEMQSEFVPFVIEEQIVGYVHQGFINHLQKFQDVFTFVLGSDGCYVAHITLHSTLETPEDRTRAVGDVIKCLGELIPGIRNELYPVTSSFGMPIFFSLERAAAPFFGIKPHGITCTKNLMKECQEEAGIPRSISNTAISVGAISYMDIDGYRYKRDILFCYDLKLPTEFVPKNEDGEVGSFRLVPVTKVANLIQRTEFFKPNCSLVIIDFLFRHGYISPDSPGYLNLMQSLRSGDCS